MRAPPGCQDGLPAAWALVRPGRDRAGTGALLDDVTAREPASALGGTWRGWQDAHVLPETGGDFALSMDELRVVARYAVEAAQEVLPIYEVDHPDDARPRAAVDAAWIFVSGAARTQLQRSTALEAHRAAKAAKHEQARYAARAAGDAAAAAYLHPLAKATQVGHILGAAANAARAAELAADDDSAVGRLWIERARQRSTPVLVEVLARYPAALSGSSRVAGLMKELDNALRPP